MTEIAKYIQRKTMLYKTGVEYGDYTMNHVLGCAHGCKYPCYAYLMKRRFGQVTSYEDWICPRIVSNTLELLDIEIPRMKSRIKSVQLCFSTDPFMYGYPEIAEMSIAAIRKLNEAGIMCRVLSKGVLPSSLADCSSMNEYGITLISLDEEYRKRMEPNAAPISERIAALQALHEMGCRTWISMEPYPTPNMIEQDLDAILTAVEFVDRIIFGRTNYNKVASSYKEHRAFYNEQTQRVISFCDEQHISYHIKEGTVTET